MLSANSSVKIDEKQRTAKYYTTESHEWNSEKSAKLTTHDGVLLKNAEKLATTVPKTHNYISFLHFRNLSMCYIFEKPIRNRTKYRKEEKRKKEMKTNPCQRYKPS